MNDKPVLSILIPWYERDELRLTLAANAPVFHANSAEVLILNCGGSSRSLRGLITASEVSGIRQLDIAVPDFNKSLALNVGLSRARSDTIFVLDADVVLLDPIPVEALDERSFVTIEWVYESAPLDVKHGAGRSDSAPTLLKSGILELSFRDGGRIRHHLGYRDQSGTVRSAAGLLLAKKRDLLDLHGYNSDLETWGWEDDDVLVRLQHVLGRRRIQCGAALHLTHGDNLRVLRESRGQSSQRNFIKCCRNYNNGLFLGTYHSDIARLTDKVTETLVDIVSPTAPGAIMRHGGQPKPPFLSGLVYCGNETGMQCESGQQWSKEYLKPPPHISELLVEAALRKYPLENSNILHVGIGGSRLATQLSSRCRHITGVALYDSERSLAAGLGFENYNVVVCDKYNDAFPGQLPLSAYDVIVDHKASDACCQRHLTALMENYSSVLAPTGSLVTAAHGNQLSEANLENLADQFNLCVRKVGCGVFALARRISIHFCAGRVV